MDDLLKYQHSSWNKEYFINQIDKGGVLWKNILPI